MLFMSKAKRLRVVLKPGFYVIDANGQRVQIPGKTVEFMNGKLETQDPEEIAALMNHGLFNSKFAAVGDEVAWQEAHPEYFHTPAQMIDGAVATVNSAQSPLWNAAKSHLKTLEKQQEKVVDLDSIIEDKINKALGGLNSKLDMLLGGMDNAKPADIPAPKAKRKFTCPVPGCGYEGRTGIEIGEHKRKEHTA